jgi:hypothetical protein
MVSGSGGREQLGFFGVGNEWRSLMNKPTLRIFGALILLFLGSYETRTLAESPKPQCEEENAVWVNETGDHRVIYYYVDGIYGWGNADVHIEQWRGSQLAWRQKGRHVCSNGHTVCRVVMEANLGESEAVIETIESNGDGISDWVVLAGINQATYYSGGGNVEWFNGFGPDEDIRLTLPENIYRFLSCKKQ